jgi:hypothetical protein
MKSRLFSILAVCGVLVLPLIVSISFILIADIDSPDGGTIRVQPRNLGSVAPHLSGN